jgi:hypothetical protein
MSQSAPEDGNGFDLLAALEVGAKATLDGIFTVLHSYISGCLAVMRVDARTRLRRGVAEKTLLGPLTLLLFTGLAIAILQDATYVLACILKILPSWVVAQEVKDSFAERGYWFFPVISAITIWLIAGIFFKIAEAIEGQWRSTKGLAVWVAYFISGAWLWGNIVLTSTASVYSILHSGARPMEVQFQDIIFWGQCAYVVLPGGLLAYSLVPFQTNVENLDEMATRPRIYGCAALVAGAILGFLTFEALFNGNAMLEEKLLSWYRRETVADSGIKRELNDAGIFCSEVAITSRNGVVCKTMIYNTTQNNIIVQRIGDMLEVKKVLKERNKETETQLAVPTVDLKLPAILKAGTGFGVEFGIGSKEGYCAMLEGATKDIENVTYLKFEIQAKAMDVTLNNGEFRFGRHMNFDVRATIGINPLINSSVDCKK